MRKFSEIRISIYDGVTDRVGRVDSLKNFLFSRRHMVEIERLRSMQTKEERAVIKKSLPAACISGTFSPTRKTENLVKHSGFICVDIDRKDNQHIENWDDLKQELRKLKEIAYIGVSVSGNGYFVIIPLRYPHAHKKQFEQLKIDFKRFGINIDQSCGDITRLRIMSYDPCPYVNENAESYAGYYREQKRPQKPGCVVAPDEASTIYKISACCERIEQTGIDITDSYDEWVKVGFALASIGEAGREFYHICSRQNGKYEYSETDKKFSELLRTGKGSVGIASFFEVCKDYGITFKY